MEVELIDCLKDYWDFCCEVLFKGYIVNDGVVCL